MGGSLFLDGTSSIQTSQAGVGLTFTSYDSNTWMIVNTFGFPLYTTIANVNTLTASTLTGTTLDLLGTISTSGVIGKYMMIQSTSQIRGPAFVSTLVVGSAPPYQTIPGYSAYVQGSAQITSNLGISGGLSVGGASQFMSSVSISSSLNVSQGASFGGNVLVKGDLQTAATGNLTTGSAVIQSTLAVIGSAVFSSNVTISPSLNVGGSITTTSATASTIQINTTAGGYLQLGAGGPILSAQSNGGALAASWNAPIYTPYLSTQSLIATGYARANVLEVYSTISAPTLTQFTMGSANIQNPSGSLSISSINTNTLVLSNLLVAPSIQTSNISVSTINIQRNLIGVSPIGYVSCAIINTSSVFTTTMSTGTLFTDVFQSPVVAVSTLIVGNSITGGLNFSVLSIPSTTILNSQGSVTTGSLYTTLLNTSTIVMQGGNIQSASTIRITAPNVSISSLMTISSLNTGTLQASTINASRITIGVSAASQSFPDFQVVGATSNIVATGGPGNYLTPYTISNVIPTGQNPTIPYTSYINFNANYYGQAPPPGLVIGYTATLFWAGNPGSFMTILGGPTLYGSYGSDQTISGTLSASTFQIQAALYEYSAISVTFSFQQSPNFNSIDPSSLIEFNNGILHWNYALNGTTIQNSLNDISTRNLYYYGSLNFASDPRIKEDIQDADLKQCYSTIAALPLCRYKYIDAYCKKFQVADTYRLGFLATDLIPHFPKSVHMSDTIFPEFSTSLLTIDTAQIEMAHIGATKYLFQEVERLEKVLENLIRATE
jgi:filamentous hemagglutinin